MGKLNKKKFKNITNMIKMRISDIGALTGFSGILVMLGENTTPTDLHFHLVMAGFLFMIIGRISEK